MAYTHHPIFLKPPLDCLYLVQGKHHWQSPYCIDVLNLKLVKTMGVESLDREVWWCMGKPLPRPSQQFLDPGRSFFKPLGCFA